MRRFIVGAAVCGALAPAVVGAQDTQSYVVRLGRDTLMLEQFTRSTAQIRGEFVLRSPRTTHRIYTADLNPDGTVRRFELITHNLDGGPGPAETRATIDFTADSAVTTAPRGDSTVTARFAAGRGAIPAVLYVVALVELAGRQARAAGTASHAVPSVGPGASRAGTATVTRLGGDTMSFSWGQVGPFTFRLDADGRLAWLTGKGSTLQVEVERVPRVDIAAAGPSFAGRPMGTLSVRDTARGTVAGVQVAVDYGRPLARGRQIFGNVVPWNTVWRTGANAATQLETSGDLLIGDAAVPAGKYTLWTLPSATGWKVIVNKQTGQWGTVYDQAQDLARVDARVETLATPVEQLTIAVGSDALVITWDRTRVSVSMAKK
jgi:hypothetical protein